MGLDRLKLISRGAVVSGALLASVGCGTSRPDRLIDGVRAGRFAPVADSVVTRVRVLPRSMLAARLKSCSLADSERFPADTTIVERETVVGESLTFAGPSGRKLYSCDGGTDPAGELARPWCGGAVGERVEGRLYDPRLNVGCRDREGRPLAYAWIEPVGGARWIGLDQGSYTEVYEVVAAYPVRVATTRGVDPGGKARLEVRYYDGSGKELVRETIDAGVAG
jgi:hypothetical protein